MQLLGLIIGDEVFVPCLLQLFLVLFFFSLIILLALLLVGDEPLPVGFLSLASLVGAFFGELSHSPQVGELDILHLHIIRLF